MAAAIFNSNAAVSLTIRLKALILNVFYSLLNSLNAALDLAIKLKNSILEAIYHRLNGIEALSFIEAFHALLGDLTLFPIALIGLHFQVLDVSTLHMHFAIVLLFFMATIVHRIAYTEIKLRPQDARYLPILSFICLVSGIIAIELLFAIIISPFWLFMVNLCPILILGVLRHLYQQIYQCVYYTANLVLNPVCSLFKKICELVDQIYDWGTEIPVSGFSTIFYKGTRKTMVCI
ncbi:uncharacterized protein LOC126703420 isoform X2 [Quercus robur]|uniref:uncharacterized protein LOC126703420 isoform X2 n=1 Tax=Quercus robur TaxID=38942 RepID=UPI0021627D26|nr:uncharacterized protein LOC126703420 isoform X2 [Quercus robur]